MQISGSRIDKILITNIERYFGKKLKPREGIRPYFPPCGRL